MIEPIVIAPVTAPPITVQPANGVPVQVTPVSNDPVSILGVAGVPGAPGISILDVESEQAPDGTVRLRFTMSDGTIHEVTFQAGGSVEPIDLMLAGSASGLALASASLHADRPLAGSAVGLASVSASLDAWLDLASIAAASGAASGSLAATLAMAGAAQGRATAAGQLSVALALSGAAVARAQASGMIQLGSDLSLQATATGLATANGMVLLVLTIAGTAAGRSTASGTVLASLDGAGSATGRGQAAGSLFAARSLAGSATGLGTAAGALTLDAGTTYDPDAQTYFAAMSVQPSDTVKARVSDFIAGLKADGLWALIEWISLRALHDTQAARLDMKTPSRSSGLSGALTFTAGKGFMGDGSAYLSTGITNASAALFSQDSATLFSFVNVSGNGPLVGASSNTFLRTGNANTQDGRVNSTTNTSVTNAPGPLGFAAVSRLNATTQRHFRNGQLIGTGSAASASAAMNEIRFYQASGIGTFAGRSALEGFGAGMTDAQIASLNTRVQTLINAIGAN